MKITDELLDSHSYKHFGKGHGCNQFHHEICDAWQKCFKDEVGKCYFITIWKWDFSEYAYHDKNLYDNPYSYEAETQLYLKNTHEYVNLTFGSQDLDEIELALCNLWKSGMWDYYELYNEN